ncbi:N-acetylmuramoyl-L-alanine amidase [Nocardia callitridis]|uniref:MurNAc-LAA domain-containing protein n=1 Tax=Nocardia callitridis TaxID=648753 RepID=A0ABP9KRH8_9NOCA
MKPGIITSGICTAAITAVTVTLSGITQVGANAEPAAPDVSTKLAGKTVFLDPGHQGSDHQENLARQVSDGRGGTKDCQTTGMTTRNGVPEHTINWNVAQLVKSSLESLGARVVLSRQDDQGWGGCVDDRARAANQSGADVAVSVHADSAPAEDHGFHLIVPALPIPDAVVDQVQAGPGLALTDSVRDAYVKAGFAQANYAGVVDGLQTRNDIAAPALTRIPQVFVEMGNGANADDAARLESQDGQVEHAIAITTGLASYLLNAPQSILPQTGSATGQPASAPALRIPTLAEVAPKPQREQSAPQAVREQNRTESVPRSDASSKPDTASTDTAPRSGPAAQSPAAPEYRAAPEERTVPRSSKQPPRSGTEQSPGAQSPDSGSAATKVLPGADGSGPVSKILQLLMPLAATLGLDDTTITSELINLAYTLAGTLLGPSK